MKVLLVYNSHAGHGFAGKILQQVETTFNKNSIEFDIQFTNYPGHGIEIVKNADLSKYDGIVAAGGDGTLFEVINGYFQNPSEIKIPIGVLPVGTGNAFARDLELDNTLWKSAIKIIGKQNTRKVDVGKFHTHGQDYYYLNILGLGFVADVTKIARSLKVFGNIAYTFGVLFRTLFLSSERMIFEIDGQKFEHDCTFVEISNTRYTANFLMAPNAVIDDGLLDVTIAKKLSRIRLIKSFPKIFTGEHVNLPEIETFQAKSIKIKSESPKILSPDGELIGITPVKIECLPQAIEIFWK
ncbi:MAG: diacylglycerol kinase family lipid kinase [Prolixibacteraceae bacterium]|jgi:diacylglycerol kinase (ATP)|nr:diacylglycerol kinase family lipid kinase [Prolixibacteraceae bacterium]MBT6766217.1 diacylglycerol kinase family lipid kinase [Prolixibacteraceae bacterium]MBT7000547.1 diacylglycerol kinase family lipid kinase [Prolixibacteraceae bacterium]MBT7393495.1 diacylglycerol kinase family lipid kinase [Prolixibacteraceae bacterium]